jgi:hypothetical protein
MPEQPFYTAITIGYLLKPYDIPGIGLKIGGILVCPAVIGLLRRQPVPLLAGQLTCPAAGAL